MITLFGHPSTRTLRILWLLHELGLEYHYHLIDFSKGDSRSSDFLALNPGGKVPVIKDGELVLTESAAILMYLAEKYSQDELIPPGNSVERAKFYELCSFITTELEQPLWLISKHKFALPKAQRVPEVMETAAWEYRKACELLSDKLADQPFLLGKKFTAVDILATQTLLWGQHFKQSLMHENLRNYLQKNLERPALKQAIKAESEVN